MPSSSPKQVLLALNCGSSSLKFSISVDGSLAGAWVIPTNEERIIAEQTYQLLNEQNQGTPT